MSLNQHAKLELEMAGFFDKDSDYGGMLGDAVMELIEVFSKQGHSGASATMVASLFNKLAKYEPLQPITGKDEEWSDVTRLLDGAEMYQNKRCSALFKEGKNGTPYYIDAIVKKDQNGVCWTGNAWLNDEDYKSGDRSKMIGSKCHIKEFPFTPKTFYIDVKDIEVAKDDWESFIVDPSQLEEVWKYYNKK